jgi:hypothetical protein
VKDKLTAPTVKQSPARIESAWHRRAGPTRRRLTDNKIAKTSVLSRALHKAAEAIIRHAAQVFYFAGAKTKYPRISLASLSIRSLRAPLAIRFRTDR